MAPKTILPKKAHEMYIDIDQISPADGYKLITNLVMPRPIAWVSTRNENGSINLAPFSFFNAIGSNPVITVISVATDTNGEPKHTAKNIYRTKEYVINLVTPDLIDQMTISAADFPEGMSEVVPAGLHTIECNKISVPRIAESKVSMECVYHSHQKIGGNNVIIGQVVAFHIADELMGPRNRIYGFHPLGRMGSPSQYVNTDGVYDYPRISYAQWLEKNRS